MYVANKLENEKRFLRGVFAEIPRIYQAMFISNYFYPDTFPDISFIVIYVDKVMLHLRRLCMINIKIMIRFDGEVIGVINQNKRRLN